MTKQVYGCKARNHQPILTYNKRDFANFSPEIEIRSLSYGYFRDCGFSMDWPTFYAVSSPVEVKRNKNAG